VDVDPYALLSIEAQTLDGKTLLMMRCDSAPCRRRGIAVIVSPADLVEVDRQAREHIEKVHGE
jgi:hypothetical protein